MSWSEDAIQNQYLREISDRFDAENETWRKAEHEAGLPLAFARDSYLWEIWEQTLIDFDANEVRIVLPTGFGLYADLVEMFEAASVVWSRVSIGAELVDGAPRVVLRLLLVDSWDDARHAAHTATAG